MIAKLAKILLLQLSIAVSYFLVACVALEFATLDVGATIIWPSSGIGVAALIRFGATSALGVFIGAFAASMYLHNPYLITWMTAIGNTLEPLLVFYMLRVLPFSGKLYNLKAYSSLIVACAIGAISSAGFGAPSLFFAGYISTQEILPVALQWWVGDVVGIILLVPFILTYSFMRIVEICHKKGFELFVLQICTGLVALLVLTNFGLALIGDIKGAYLFAIPLVWSIFRFGQSITALIVIQFFVVGVYGLLTQQGVFIQGDEIKLGKFLSFFSMTAIVSMIASYLASDRNTLFQAINNSQVEAYIFYGDTMNFEFVNNTALLNLGISQIDSVKLTPFDLIFIEDKTDFQRQFQQLQKQKIQRIVLETHYQRKDKSFYPVEVNIQRVEDNSRDCYLALVTDISERKEKEQKLLESHENLIQAQQLAHLGNWEYDQQTKSLRWSDESYRIFEKNPLIEPVSYEMFLNSVHPDDRGLVDKAFKELLNTEQHYKMEHRLLMPDGRIKYVQEQCETFYDENGIAVISKGCVLDITKNKMRELELQEANDLAEKASSIKSEFLANMSHELRTPMHGILSFARLGLKNVAQGDLEKLAKYFDRINISGERLLVLLNDLLDLSKLEAGKMELDLRPNDLKKALEKCLLELESSIQEQQLEIKINCETNDLSAIFDEIRIGQVITNLLSNAIKFSPEGQTIFITMVRKLKGSEPYLYFRIQDQGVGIPEDELSLVFDKFAQSSKTKSNAGGTGLGLAICKEIMDVQGGGIWAESIQDEGAVFQFNFPVSQNANSMNSDNK